MSTPTELILSRKQPDPKLEARVVPIVIGNTQHLQYFFVHEDLICLSSPYFRRAIQPKRKSLEDKLDHECSICYELIDIAQDHIKVCQRKCGTSFHSTCLTTWFSSQRPAQPTCPYCRQDWKVPSLYRQAVKFPDLSPKLYPMYHNWLYTKQICIKDVEENGRTVPGHWTWLRAYYQGLIIEENKFCQAVLEAAVELCKVSNTVPPPRVVEFAYKDPSRSLIRKFLVSIYVEAPHVMLTDQPEAHRLPDQFFRDFFKVSPEAHRKLPTEWDVAKVKEKLCLDIDHINPPAS